jgi:UDP-N-acetylmuramyl pentapeptide phosphotransferase/UDP-N-acetylglucosamine-1-phosphate transferase
MSGSATPVVAFLAFVMSFVGAGVLTRLNLLPDRPNQRSMHTRITPRSGGLALLLPFLGSLLIFTISGGWSEQLAAVLAGTALFSLIGLVDDAVQLSALVRLILQITGAAALCLFAGPQSLEIFDVVALGGPACFVFQVGWICLCVNFFNFMDGMDGLAGVQAFFFALPAGVMILLSGQESPALGKALICLASSILGFLCWNLRPSTLFMGDSGSYLLGFIIGFLPLIWGPPARASRAFELRPDPDGGAALDFHVWASFLFCAVSCWMPDSPFMRATFQRRQKHFFCRAPIASLPVAAHQDELRQPCLEIYAGPFALLFLLF